MLINESADWRSAMLVRFKLTHAAVAAVLFIAEALSAQSPPKTDNLIVYGKDFAFRVKEPDGWHGDTEDIAKEYHVNVIFLPSQEESLKNDVTIRVSVNKKQDENTIEDLNYDMEQYKKQFPTAQFSDLHVAHSDYRTFAKTVFGKTIQFLCRDV
jgi:hypothetical protein